MRLRGGRSTALGQRLQNLHYVMKKDPQSYLPEVQGHVDNWNAALRAWERAPDSVHQELGELSVFLGSNINNFPGLLHDFGAQLLALLGNSTRMASDLRLAVTKAVAIANSRKSISVPNMCGAFFGMFHLPDKRLRTYLYTTCLGAIMRLNSHSVNLDVNRGLQRQLAAFLHGSDTRSGRIAVSLMVQLYRRSMWADAHIVNLMAAACFSRQSAVRVAALHFFLGIDDDMEHDEEEEADGFGIHRNNAASAGVIKGRIKIQQITTSHNKRKKKKLRVAFGEQLKADKRRRMGLEPTAKESKKKGKGSAFSVLEHLHDPYTFAERLLLALKRWGSALKLEHKLLMMELIARVMAHHRVVLLEFYEWMVRYITPQQESLHSVLASLATSVTELTPPDTVLTVVRHVTTRFVYDKSRDTSITIGLNVIREICRRQPLGMDSELLADLVDYDRHRDRAVVNAARSLKKTFRLLNPTMLRKKDRGRQWKTQEEKHYGAVHATARLPGAAELEEEERKIEAWRAHQRRARSAEPPSQALDLQALDLEMSSGLSDDDTHSYTAAAPLPTTPVAGPALATPAFSAAAFAAGPRAPTHGAVVLKKRPRAWLPAQAIGCDLARPQTRARGGVHGDGSAGGKGEGEVPREVLEAILPLAKYRLLST